MPRRLKALKSAIPGKLEGDGDWNCSHNRGCRSLLCSQASAVATPNYLKAEAMKPAMVAPPSVDACFDRPASCSISRACAEEDELQRLHDHCCCTLIAWEFGS